MIEMGILVGIGLLVTLVKMSWSMRMWMLSHPVLLDILIMTILMLIHWGTFSGIMVATFGTLTCSLTLSAARKLYGYRDATGYVPGFFNVADKL
jgi:hypothetical protein